jgi:hypothetical protein
MSGPQILCVIKQFFCYVCVKKMCQESTVVGQISFDDIWGQRKCVDPTFMSSEQLSVSVNGLRRYAFAIDS